MGPLEQLHEKNFTFIENVFSSDELNELESELDKIIFANSQQVKHVDFHRPSKIAKSIIHSKIFYKCKKISEELFQKKCYCLYDHAIYKYGLCDIATAWHQDQAYLGKSIPIDSLTFWIPFQDTDALNGGLIFAKQSPKHLLQHEKIIDKGITQLAINFASDPEYKVNNIKKGGVSIHNNWAIHASTKNSTGLTRKAWIVHFSPTHPLLKRIYQIKARLIKSI